MQRGARQRCPSLRLRSRCWRALESYSTQRPRSAMVMRSTWQPSSAVAATLLPALGLRASRGARGVAQRWLARTAQQGRCPTCASTCPAPARLAQLRRRGRPRARELRPQPPTWRQPQPALRPLRCSAGCGAVRPLRAVLGLRSWGEGKSLTKAMMRPPAPPTRRRPGASPAGPARSACVVSRPCHSAAAARLTAAPCRRSAAMATNKGRNNARAREVGGGRPAGAATAATTEYFN